MKKFNSKGFTLIEVLITLSILSTITVLTTQAIQHAIKAKAKLTDQLDEVSKVRDALKIIEKDINLAYHYRDIETEFAETLKSLQKKPPTPTEPQPESQEPRVDPTTKFMGEDSKVNFPTMNSSRLMKGTLEAEYIEIGYYVASCKNLSTGESTDCLWRRRASIVDEDVEKGGEAVVLLENIQEFKLRYIGKGKQDWVNDWKSSEGGDDVTKNHFPQAVEVNLTVASGKDDKKKKVKMQIIAAVRFPNNPPPKEEQPNMQNPDGPTPQ